jgi:glycosyltransferase involved in cell wall biosynthesis
LNQIYPNIEIVVSDNASPDHTADLVKSYDDKRIRYFRQEENIGSKGNMNFCLEQARGVYFQMLHDDDTIEPDFIETCMRGADYREDAGLIMTGARIIDEQGNVVAEKENITSGYSTEDFFLAWYRQEILMLLCSVLFNTRLLREAGGFREEYGNFDDVAAEFTVAARMRRVDIPEVKATFRNHAASHGKAATIAEWCDNSLSLVRLACDLVDNKRDELFKTAMSCSAERMYRYATRLETKASVAKTFFIVWKKFGYRYLPPKKYQYRVFPFLRYVYSPFSLPGKILYRYAKPD